VRVAKIMQREVPKVEPDATLREAARTMRKWQTSAVMVTVDDRAVGILTERDLVQVLVDGENAALFRVSSRMSTDLVSVSPDADSRVAMDLMAKHGIRHLPVVEGDDLVGLVSLQDHVTKLGAPKAARSPEDLPYSGGAEPGGSFHGPYYDGPPASALVVETPTLSRFGMVELRRMAVVAVILHLAILRSLLRVLHRPRRATLAAACAKGLVNGFEQLGPTYVKLGQLIASSPGIFPKPLSDEAMRCLDEVPPFDGATCRELICEQLGRPISELFLSFDEEPLAAASVGQVHACVLLDGRDAVVKLQRPNIRERMGADLRIMHRLAQILERLSRTARSANVVGVVEDLHAVTFQEPRGVPPDTIPRWDLGLWRQQVGHCARGLLGLLRSQHDLHGAVVRVPGGRLRHPARTRHRWCALPPPGRQGLDGSGAGPRPVPRRRPRRQLVDAR